MRSAVNVRHTNRVASVGDRIKAARKKAGRSKASVYRAAGVSRTQYDEYESLDSESVPDGYTKIYAVANVLGMDLPLPDDAPEAATVTVSDTAGTSQLSDREFVEWLAFTAQKRHLVAALAKIIYNEDPSGDGSFPFADEAFRVRGVTERDQAEGQAGDPDVNEA